ncbi:hypothetical protein HU200_011550 [Digitaria exilis]|uniref:Uncharacterized protein n=1 Tax=Digitaria exilis TaxID=1010633 RepID=A0A835FG71_9POAL|nr:hypothetical protein HU200_011550 [Digitaria exilis]
MPSLVGAVPGVVVVVVAAWSLRAPRQAMPMRGAVPAAVVAVAAAWSLRAPRQARPRLVGAVPAAGGGCGGGMVIEGSKTSHAKSGGCGSGCGGGCGGGSGLGTLLNSSTTADQGLTKSGGCGSGCGGGCGSGMAVEGSKLRKPNLVAVVLGAVVCGCGTMVIEGSKTNHAKSSGCGSGCGGGCGGSGGGFGTLSTLALRSVKPNPVAVALAVAVEAAAAASWSLKVPRAAMQGLEAVALAAVVGVAMASY